MASAGDIVVSLVLDGAGEFEAQVRRTSKTLDKLSGSTDKYSKASSTASSKTETLTHKMRDYAIILGLARSALENVSDLAFALPKAILEQNALIERNTALLTGLNAASMDTAEAQAAANVEMEKMIRLSSASPYALAAITDSYTKLRVSGIENTEDAMSSLVDTMAKYGSTSEQLKRGSIAISQLMGKGVLSMEELRQQLGEAVPGIMQIMSRALNMPMGEMVKKISEGKVEAESALKAMFDEMAWSSMGAAGRMADTWDGLINQIGNSWTVFAKKVGDAGFFENMKDIAREFRDALSGGELNAFAQDLSDGLSAAARAGTELAKVLAQNIKLIAALAAGFAAVKLGQSAMAKASVAVQNAGKFATGYATRIEKGMATADRHIQRHFNAMQSISSRAWNATYQEAARTGASLNDLSGIYKKHEDRLAQYHWNRINRAREFQGQLTSNSRMLKTVGSNLFNALGGWTTALSLGIAGAMYALDELVLKHMRAADAINATRGQNASVEQYENALTREQQLVAKLEKVKKNKSMSFMAGSEGLFDSQVAEIERELAELRANLPRALDSIMQDAGKMGESRASYRIGDATQEIAASYEQGMKDLQAARDKSLEEKVDPEEAQKQLMAGQEALREKQLGKLEALIGEEKDYWNDALLRITSQYGEGQEISVADQQQIAQIEAAIAHLDSVYEKFEGKTGAHTWKEITANITQAGKGLSAVERRILSHKEAVVKLDEKQAAQKDGYVQSTYQQIEAQRIEQDYYGKITEQQKEQLILKAKLRDEAEAEAAAIKKAKELEQERKDGLEDADTLITRMSRSVNSAKADLDANDNPFLAWTDEHGKNLASIDGLIQKLEETGGVIDEVEQAKIDLAKTTASEAAAYDILNLLQKEHNQLQEELNGINGNLTEEQQQLAYLDQLEEKLKAVTDPQLKQQIENMIKAVRGLTEQRHSNKGALQSSYQEWIKQADEIEETISDGIFDTLDGAMDAWIDTMFDAEASFGDMVESMVQDLEKLIVKMAMMAMIQKAMGWMGGMFGGGDAAASASASAVPVASSSVAMTPQDATFGVSGASSASTMGVSSMSATSQPPAVVNVINQSGVQMEAQMGGSRFDGEKYITDVVMKAAARPGKFRNSMQGLSK